MELQTATSFSPAMTSSSAEDIKGDNPLLKGTKKLKIYTFPHPLLGQIAGPVDAVNEEIRELCLNMIHTMYQSNGIGLAAPQIGSGLRIFVIDIDYQRNKVLDSEGNEKDLLTDHNPQVFINPVFRDKNGEVCYQEGCLSIPGIYEDIQRSQNITVDFINIDGQKKTLTTTDLLSICIQHENDHLDGIVFLDRLSPIKKNLLQKKILKQKKQKMKAAKEM